MTSILIRRSIHAAVIFILSTSPVAALTVMLYDADVSNRVIRLGDVATFQGASINRMEELRETVIGYAPQPGTRRVIPLDTIRVHILAHGYIPADVKFVGKEPVVTRRAQLIPDAMISEAVLGALRPMTRDGVQFEITRISGLRPMPEGPVEITVRTPNEIKKNFFVTADVSVGEEKTQTYVTLSAVRIERVVVAGRRIERGDLITEGDVQFESRDLYSEPRDVILDSENVLGHRASRMIMPGKSITGNAVEPDIWVKRGEKINIVVRMPGFVLKARGESFGTGSQGQTVRVKNLGSGQYVTGKITAPGEVTVLE